MRIPAAFAFVAALAAPFAARAVVSPAPVAPAAPKAPKAPKDADKALGLTMAAAIGNGMSRREHAANLAALEAARIAAERRAARIRRANRVAFRALLALVLFLNVALLAALAIGRLF